MISLFFSYSHKDENLRDQLETHLSMLKRQGVVSTWHDRRLAAGDDINNDISDELEKAEIILLLASPDFLASDYCYGIEMTRALERHATGEARVIPVILRPCDWRNAPFGGLLATPKDGKPVTRWTDPDEAFLDVTRAIRAAAGSIGGSPAPQATRAPNATRAIQVAGGPRSSNLRVRKSFTEQDRDRFIDEGFEFMARFFQNSLAELETRNPDISTDFKRIDTVRFTAAIYRGGKAISRCQIRRGGMFGNGISFSYNANLGDNSTNENLSVEDDNQSLYFKPLGMALYGNIEGKNHLSFEGAAEYYWELLLKNIQ